MTNEFTAVVERDEHWFVAYSPEIPGANGQGKTKEEALESLSAAISLILEDRREDGVDFRRMLFGRRSSSSEARRSAAPSEAARVLPLWLRAGGLKSFDDLRVSYGEAAQVLRDVCRLADRLQDRGALRSAAQQRDGADEVRDG